MKDVLDLIARIFVAGIFFFEAYDSIAYFKIVKTTMTNYGLTWNQDFLLMTTIVFLITGATLVLIGYRSSLGALLLLIYWVPVTIIVYSFWNDTEELRRLHSILFMRNFGVTGALLLIIINNSGKFSVRRLLNSVRVPKSRI